jgi:hypothetical protein
MTEAFYPTQEGLHPRRPEVAQAKRGSDLLRLIEGEDTAERFTRVDHYLRFGDGGIEKSGAYTFFFSAYRSFDYRMHIGVYKKALNHLKLRPDEQKIEEWRTKSVEEIGQMKAERKEVTPFQMQKLRDIGDPIIHIYDTLELICEQEYPNIMNDVRLKAEKADVAQKLILQSIHGRLVS